MEYKISGDNLQLVTIEMEPGEKMFAEAGSMVYMSANINMEAKIRGGFLKGIGRKFAGETENIDIIDPYYTSRSMYNKVLKIIDNFVVKAIDKIIEINKSNSN